MQFISDMASLHSRVRFKIRFRIRVMFRPRVKVGIVYRVRLHAVPSINTMESVDGNHSSFHGFGG